MTLKNSNAGADLGFFARKLKFSEEKISEVDKFCPPLEWWNLRNLSYFINWTRNLYAKYYAESINARLVGMLPTVHKPVKKFSVQWNINKTLSHWILLSYSRNMYDQITGNNKKYKQHIWNKNMNMVSLQDWTFFHKWINIPHAQSF